MSENDNVGISPVVASVKPQVKLLSFPEAIAEVSSGRKITKEEWNDKRTYGFLKEGLLQIHKAGEDETVFRPWIINDGDLLGKDWFVL
jgi:hypothetical protein